MSKEILKDLVNYQKKHIDELLDKQTDMMSVIENLEAQIKDQSRKSFLSHPTFEYRLSDIEHNILVEAGKRLSRSVSSLISQFISTAEFMEKPVNKPAKTLTGSMDCVHCGGGHLSEICAETSAQVQVNEGLQS